MLQVSTEGKEEFLEQLRVALSKKMSAAQVQEVMDFAESYYATASMEDIAERSTDDLYGATLSTWHFIQKHDLHQPKIRVFNPDFEQNGWQSPHTIIEILHKDMPFLVDSIRIELNRRELTVHAIHNAVLQVQRDAKHQLQRVSRMPAIREVGEAQHETGGEALIYIEVDRHTDERSLEKLATALEEVLGEVRAAVADFDAMQAKTGELVEVLQKNAPGQVENEELQEACDFLTWLNTHFTFLGYEEFSASGKRLKAVQDSELGILTLPQVHRALCPHDKPVSARQFLQVPDLLVFAKAPEHSRVHRPTYPDYISVKRYGKDGQVVGESRFLGLYTSTVYNQSPRNIPVLRKKIAEIIHRSGLPPDGHSGKQLLQVLEVFPRDELFQTDLDELLRTVIGILNIRERRKVRLFVREDRFGKLYSCLVFVPRDIYSTHLRIRMQHILCEELDATGSEFYTYFSESVLARTQFLLRFRSDQPPDYDVGKIERKIIQCARSWNDDLLSALVEGVGEERANSYMALYRDAFPSSYLDDFSPRTAVYDIQHIDELADEVPLAMSFYRQLEQQTDAELCFKVFHREAPLPLSDVLPVLENMGLRVLGEHPYEIKRTDGQVVWVHNFYLVHGARDGINLSAVREIFQETFARVWQGDADNDAFNRLVLAAHLNWREVTLLRAYARYMKQIRFGLSQDYIANTLYTHPDVTRLLVALFKLRFDPAGGYSETEAKQYQKRIEEALEQVQSLSEDRTLRRFLDMIKATRRTNFYQLDAEGESKTYIAYKLSTKAIPEMPRPRPLHEIFVYSPRMEGVHLRGGKVARGGLRWSDRLEDFRTEILGLVKAQQVKNAVIVPVGAKGGFVAKNLPMDGREAIQCEGIECYQTFIRGLLDITDNLVGGLVVPPPQVVRHDDDDPYLVVAADKGTATFSDIANTIAEEYDFWLKDAFASGGSAGYDHKKMGITARGAWVSVERHFREMGLNTRTTDFTVVGIGDMSGDVFGNGMLLSPHIRLVAAFNHRHIFIDPDPDAARSFEERQRLFRLPRSGWDDYSPELISEGGGVFSRDAKSIVITQQMKAVFGIKASRLTPSELISEILRAPVDLLWNGGIGTYVKASYESHAEVGDKANDSVRINASELRCKVIGEGGNLGLTQRARIEYARKGGHCNTDFIDNSGGVDCSDHEVNIKILLEEVIAEGDMTRKQRNQLLTEMTDNVAQLVLQNNYRQAQAISLAQAQSLENMGHFRRLINHLEAQKQLDRNLEFLPSDEELQERQAAGQEMSRPALAILISYAKSYLKAALVESGVPDDDYICREMEKTFPSMLVQRYRTELYRHRLLREIVATQLANDLVNHMGITFVHRLQEYTGVSTAEVVHAYIVARDVFDLPRLWRQVEQLDYITPANLQHGMMLDLMRLIRRAARWFLRHCSSAVQTADLIQQFAPKVRQIRTHMDELLRGLPLENWQARKAQLHEEQVPEPLATDIAGTTSLYAALGVIGAARDTGQPLQRVADIYFLLGDRLELPWFSQQIHQLPVSDNWQALARETFRDDLDSQQRALTINVLQLDTEVEDSEALVDLWMKRHATLVQRWHAMLTELRTSSGSEYPMYSVAMRELLDLAQSNV